MDKIPYSDIEFARSTAKNEASGKRIVLLNAVHRHTKKILGEMEWHAHNGEISWIHTGEKYRRKGVATHMLTAARETAAHYGVSAPTMSPVHTDDGVAWAKSAGLSVPAKLSGVCRDCSTLRDGNGYCPCYHRSYVWGSEYIENGKVISSNPGGPKIGDVYYTNEY